MDIKSLSGKDAKLILQALINTINWEAKLANENKIEANEDLTSELFNQSLRDERNSLTTLSNALINQHQAGRSEARIDTLNLVLDKIDTLIEHAKEDKYLLEFKANHKV